MLISHSHRFLFFHVAKVAGLSIREALQAYVQEPEHFKIRRPPRTTRDGRPNPLYAIWESALTHARARDAQAEFGADYGDFFSFAFVRNPWDWQVSMYHFLLKEADNPRHDLVHGLGSFEAYLAWVMQTDKPYPKGATKFQHEMVVDDGGEICVDFIGRYETLAEDFAKVRERLGIAAELPLLNQSGHRDYREYYTPRMVDWVAEHFRRDIELFGYRFAE